MAPAALLARLLARLLALDRQTGQVVHVVAIPLLALVIGAMMLSSVVANPSTWAQGQARGIWARQHWLRPALPNQWVRGIKERQGVVSECE